jgi:hypothetical protein
MLLTHPTLSDGYVAQVCAQYGLFLYKQLKRDNASLRT